MQPKKQLGIVCGRPAGLLLGSQECYDDDAHTGGTCKLPLGAEITDFLQVYTAHIKEQAQLQQQPQQQSCWSE